MNLSLFFVEVFLPCLVACVAYVLNEFSEGAGEWRNTVTLMTETRGIGIGMRAFTIWFAKDPCVRERESIREHEATSLGRQHETRVVR